MSASTESADRLTRAHAARPGAVAERLNAEVGLLLGVAAGTPDVETMDQLLRAIAARAAEQIDAPGYPFDPTATRALVRQLASDRARPLESLVRDLAEILLLPRHARSEYTENRTGAPPYRIGKLLLEYAVSSRRIDAIVGALTKEYCATACDRLPVGCCSIDGYDMGVMPSALLAAQELEARRRGWRPPASHDKCKFHGARGCALVLFKSPACVGMLCDALVALLRRRHPAARLEPFLAALAELRVRDIDRERVFVAQRGVIDTGTVLVRER
jgi:hypothetical protein